MDFEPLGLDPVESAAIPSTGGHVGQHGTGVVRPLSSR
jgi:hypothetical protein